MTRRYGKKLKAQIAEIDKNPALVLKMTQKEYGIFCERVHKTPELYNKLPKTVIDGWTGERYLKDGTC